MQIGLSLVATLLILLVLTRKEYRLELPNRARTLLAISPL